MPSLENPALSRLRRVASIARFATGLLLVGMFVATHIPVPPIGFHFSYADKVLHCLMYTGLSFSVLASWDLTVGLLRPAHYFTVWLAGTLYGAFDEVTQIPVGRNCDGLDWLCDILGIVIGLTLFRVSRSLIYRLFVLFKTPVSSAA